MLREQLGHILCDMHFSVEKTQIEKFNENDYMLRFSITHRLQKFMINALYMELPSDVNHSRMANRLKIILRLE